MWLLMFSDWGLIVQKVGAICSGLFVRGAKCPDSNTNILLVDNSGVDSLSRFEFRWFVGSCIALTCFAMWSKRVQYQVFAHLCHEDKSVQYQVFAHLCHEDKSVHTNKFDLNFASTANICQFYGCNSLLQSSLNQIQMWHLRALPRWANLARK